MLLGLILALGATLRHQAVEYTWVDKPIRSDAADYLAYAWNLRYLGIYSPERGHGADQTDATPAPSMRRTPGYVLFLLPFVEHDDGPNATTRQRLKLIGHVQAALSTLTLLLIALIARALVPAALALGVALLTAISPHLINANVYLLTESLHTFLLVLGLALYLLGCRLQRIRWLVACALILGLAALTRPWMQYFPLLLAAHLLLSHALPRPKLAATALLITFALTLSPWYLRNHITFGTASDGADMAGSLLHGSYPNLMYRNDPRTFGFPYRFDPWAKGREPGLGEVIGKLTERISANPMPYLEWYAGRKIVVLTSWNIIQGMGDAFIYRVLTSPYAGMRAFTLTHGFMKAIHPWLHLLAVIGAILVWLPGMARRMRPELICGLRMLSLLFGYFLAVHTVFAPFPRYNIPMLPVNYLLALSVPLLLSRLTASLPTAYGRPKP